MKEQKTDKAITQAQPSSKPLDFDQARAFLVGVSRYRHMAPLQTPVNDVHAIAATLEQYRFQTAVLDNPDRTALKDFFEKLETENLPEQAPVLLYFAGHGVAFENEQGIRGYMMPADAEPGDKTTWYDMADLVKALSQLPTRHLFLVFDCCFGGAIRWASQHRKVFQFSLKEPLNKNHYHYFTQRPAWQVLTSTAPDQTALDFIQGDGKGEHSPFARCLLDGLKNAQADLSGDGVITATELCQYLKDRFKVIQWHKGHQQNVEIYPLQQHRNGEFLFCPKGFNPNDLQPALMQNPYMGLEPYDADHSDVFFGREEATEALLEKVHNNNLVVVSGASGMGKSSLVRAGVIPRLQQRDIPVIKPGRNPFAAIQPVNEAPVLVVDQLEQLVTQSEKQEITAFWQALKQRVEKGLKTILTVRIDFEAQLEIPESLQKPWEAGLSRVPVFSAEDLRKIIVSPTTRVGRFIDPPGLVDDIIEAVIHFPGSLPLLSFTMKQLFEVSNDKNDLYRRITQQDYQALGGVIGALQKSADALYHRLSADEQQTMRRMMLRMVSLAGGETAGKRVLLSELVFDDPAENDRIEAVRRPLEEARLIQAGGEPGSEKYLEPTHDALVRVWKVVQDWIRELGDGNLLICSKVGEATRDWVHGNKSPEFLWVTNPWVEISLDLQAQQLYVFNASETAFLKASQLAKSDRIKELQAERDEAIRQKSLAEKRARAANNTAVFSRVMRENTTLAVQMMWKNWQDHPENELSKRMWDRIVNHEKQCFIKDWVSTNHKGRVINQLSFYPELNLLLTCGADKTLNVWNLQNNKRIKQFRHSAEVIAATLLPDKRRLVSIGWNHEIVLSDLETGERLKSTIPLPQKINTIAIAPDARSILTAYKDHQPFNLWDSETAELIQAYNNEMSSIRAVCFSPDGLRFLVAGSIEQEPVTALWDIATGQCLKQFRFSSAEILCLAFSPDGKTFVSGSMDGSVIQWDIAQEKPIRFFGGMSDGISTVMFSPDGNAILAGGNAGSVVRWNVQTGKIISTYVGHAPHGITVAAFLPGKNDEIITTDLEGKAWTWLSGKFWKKMYRFSLEDLHRAGYQLEADDLYTLYWEGSERLSVEELNLICGTTGKTETEAEEIILDRIAEEAIERIRKNQPI